MRGYQEVSGEGRGIEKQLKDFEKFPRPSMVSNNFFSKTSSWRPFYVGRRFLFFLYPSLSDPTFLTVTGFFQEKPFFAYLSDLPGFIQSDLTFLMWHRFFFKVTRLSFFVSEKPFFAYLSALTFFFIVTRFFLSEPIFFSFMWYSFFQGVRKARSQIKNLSQI